MKGISAIFCTLAVLATSVAAIPSNNAPRFPYQGMEASAVGQKRSMIIPRQRGNSTEEIPGAPSPIFEPVGQQPNQPAPQNVSRQSNSTEEIPGAPSPIFEPVDQQNQPAQPAQQNTTQPAAPARS